MRALRLAIQWEKVLESNQAVAFECADMAGLFSLFQKREEERPADTGEPVMRRAFQGAGTELWRMGYFQSYPVGEQLQAVRTAGVEPWVLPSFAVEFAYGCQEFRPLREHVRSHAEKHGWESLQVTALEREIPRLIEAGAMVSMAGVRERMLASGGARVPSPTIEAIGFPTGGKRVHFLERALRSFAENVKAHGRSARFLVADSSAEPDDAAVFRKRAGELARELGVQVQYAGEAEKRRFAAALVRKGACSLATAEFALLDPLKIGFACGANRNVLLLHEAGRALCSVDDDVVCKLARPPAADTAAELICFSNRDPYSRWQFPDRDATWSAADWVDRDFLAAHESMLASTGGHLFQAPLEKIDCELLNDEFLRRAGEPETRVRATFTGHVGDPGIPTSVYYLFYDRDNRERLTQSEAHYRSVFASRSVLSTFRGPAIGDPSVCPGMAMGLDHRELLPPFFPVLHAEDYIWGATLWQSCPEAWLGHVPLAIQHDTGPGKPILLPSDLGGDRRVVIFEWAHLLRRIILGFRIPAGADSRACMIALGRYLEELANVPDAEFRETLASEVLAHESEKLGWLEKQLEEDVDSPEFWREDVRAYLDHVRHALTYEDFDIPYDLKSRGTPPEVRRLMQRMVLEFGALLQAWPAMVQAAGELRDSGEPLMV